MTETAKPLTEVHTEAELAEAKATTGTGTFTLRVSPAGQLHFSLEEGEKRIAVITTPDEMRNLGRDFFAAAARADLLAEAAA
jgi:hypothetical protein